MRALLLTLLAGCTWVYDAQYDDRREELEAFRSEFLPGDERVQFMAGSTSRFYWVALDRQFETHELHSYHPGIDVLVDFTDTELDRPLSAFEQDMRYGDELIVQCAFGTATAWDAETGVELGRATENAGPCAIAGRQVYFVVGGASNRGLYRWDPATGAPPAQVMDLSMPVLGDGAIGGLGVEGNQLLLVEGPRLWLVDLTALTATWLENEVHDVPPGALIVFDDTGVIFDSTEGVTYLRFDDKVPRSFDAMIADGGYKLSSNASDIQELADDGNFMMYGRYIIYRGRRGIFAYHLDTGKVTDILLDKGEGFEAEAIYRGATVTADGTLFVQHRNGLSSDERPVYQVDLTDRLP